MSSNATPILEALVKSASLVVKAITDNIDTKRVSSNIKSAMSISKADISDGTASISIIIDTEQAPEATAFEWGSGIHATRGVQKKYTIEPKNATKLKFPFTLTYMPGSKFLGMKGYKNRYAVWRELQGGDHGQVSGESFWAYVEHPGIEPKPYIEPAVLDTMGEVTKLLGTSFIVDVLIGDRKVITIP